MSPETGHIYEYESESQLTKLEKAHGTLVKLRPSEVTQLNALPPPERAAKLRRIRDADKKKRRAQRLARRRQRK